MTGGDRSTNSWWSSGRPEIIAAKHEALSREPIDAWPWAFHKVPLTEAEGLHELISKRLRALDSGGSVERET